MRYQTRNDLEKERHRIRQAIGVATKTMYKSEPTVQKILAKQRHSLSKRLALIDLILGFGEGSVGYIERFFLAAKEQLAPHEFTRLSNAAFSDRRFNDSAQGLGNKLSDSKLIQLFADDDT